MSHFTCDAGKVYYPFGKGGKSKILEELSLNTLYSNLKTAFDEISFHSIPLISQDNYTNNSNELQNIYQLIANNLIIELFKLQIKSEIVSNN